MTDQHIDQPLAWTRLDYALDLAARGFHVIPLGDGPQEGHTLEAEGKQAKASKEPRIKWKTYQERPAAPEEIRKWWTQWPVANIGVVTGTSGGAVVIDADSSAAEAWIEANMPRTPWRITTGKGRHYYYAHDPAVTVPNVARANVKIDTRGAGGYVVAPGSMHYSGRPYSWDVLECDISNPKDLPPLTIENIQAIDAHDADSKPRADAQLLKMADYRSDGEHAEVGERNNKAASLVGRYIQSGDTEAEALIKIQVWNQELADPLPNEEICTVVRSIAKTHASRSQAAAPLPPPTSNPWAANERSEEEVANAPASAWRIKGVLPAEGIAAVFGAPSAGKSFLVLDLLAHIAEGVEWFGHKVKQAAAVYIYFEDRGGIRDRTRARRDARFPSSMRIVDASGMSLTDPVPVAALAEYLTPLFKAGGVVVLDTLAAASPGMDENSSEGMGALIHNLKAVQASAGGLVLAVHHTGKDQGKGPRGHSSLLGALDAAILVSQYDNGDCAWKVTKSKRGRAGIERDFTLDIVDVGEDEDGDMETSCVVRSNQLREAELRNQRLRKQASDDECACALIAEGCANGRRPSKNAVEASIRRAGNDSNISRTAFREALIRLKAAGRVGEGKRSGDTYVGLYLN